MSQFDHFVGTRPVTGTHAFDVLTLEGWLGDNMPGFQGPLSVEMFKGGQSNPTYTTLNHFTLTMRPPRPLFLAGCAPVVGTPAQWRCA